MGIHGGNSVPGRRSSQCKCPEAGLCLASLKDSRKASGAIKRYDILGLYIMYTYTHFVAVSCNILIFVFERSKKVYEKKKELFSAVIYGSHLVFLYGKIIQELRKHLSNNYLPSFFGGTVSSKKEEYSCFILLSVLIHSVSNTWQMLENYCSNE